MADLSIGSRVRAAINTIVLARHGKAEKLNPTDPDEARVLNEIGIAQAEALGEKLKPFKFDKVLGSPLKRVPQTLALATGNCCMPISKIPELTCSTDPSDPIMMMWNELGNKAISAFFAHPLGEHLKAWGRTAVGAILERVSNGHRQSVLVGGHAVLNPTVAWAILEALEKNGGGGGLAKAKGVVLENTLAEAEAFNLSFPRGDGGYTITCEHIRLD